MCLGPGLSERYPQTILGGSKFSWRLVCKSSRYVSISDETICLRERPLKPLQPKGICLLETLLSKKHNHHILFHWPNPAAGETFITVFASLVQRLPGANLLPHSFSGRILRAAWKSKQPGFYLINGETKAFTWGSPGSGWQSLDFNPSFSDFKSHCD